MGEGVSNGRKGRRKAKKQQETRLACGIQENDSEDKTKKRNWRKEKEKELGWQTGGMLIEGGCEEESTYYGVFFLKKLLFISG